MPLGTTLNQAETSSASSAVSTSSFFRNMPEGREIDLMVVAAVLARRKKIILLFATATALLVAVTVFFLIRPTYTAEAVFLPPQTPPGSSMAQLASQLGSMDMLSTLGGLKSPGDVYVGILGSRTIADDLIKQFDLRRVYKAKRLSDAEEALKSNSTFEAGKNTLVTISVEDHNSSRAAAMANAYLAELTSQNGRLALTGTSQRRLFFEQQMEHEESALSEAEVALKKMEEQTGFIAPIDQSRAAISNIEETRAQITTREIELSSLAQSNTEQNPDVIRIRAEIAALRKQLQTLQDGQEKNWLPGNVQHSAAKVPALELEYVRKARDVAYHEFLFDMLAKQYEAARLDESRDAPVLQVIDYAAVPDKKSGPHRIILTAAGFLVGAIAGSLWVLVGAGLAERKRIPAY
jgi:uncharacterized protein involved in exopolysaccharide biosynthesis